MLRDLGLTQAMFLFSVGQYKNLLFVKYPKDRNELPTCPFKGERHA